MNKLRSAIIGCGGIHPLHAAGIEQSSDTELAIVCDIDESKARRSAEENSTPDRKVEYCTDYHDILNDPSVDAVHITLPHYLHVPVSIEALNAGKHVFSEKPMGISLDDALSLKKAAEQTDRQYGICFQNRYNLVSQKAREFLDSGKGGKIKGSAATVLWMRDRTYYDSGDWRGRWDTEGGGVLINQAIHTLDLQLWLTGMPVSLKGDAYTSILEDRIEVEDTASAVFRYEDGSKRGVYFASNCNAGNSPVRLEIFCENATITMDDDLRITDNDGCVIANVSGNHTLEGEKSYWGTGHASIIKDFYRCLAEGKRFGVGIDEGIKTMRVIDAIYRSARSGDFAKL